MPLDHAVQQSGQPASHLARAPLLICPTQLPALTPASRPSPTKQDPATDHAEKQITEMGWVTN